MNMLAPVGVKLAFGSLMAVGLLSSHHHAAAAVPASEAAAGVQILNTLTDGHPQLQTFVNVDVDGEWYSLPVCQFEDCSDQPGGVGAWRDPDTGTWWASFGEDVSYRVSYSKMGGRVR